MIKTILILMTVFLLTACAPRLAERKPSDSAPITLSISLTATIQATESSVPSSHPFAGKTAWIAYHTVRSGSKGVWLIHPDGMQDHQIAADGLTVLLPDWSPDGKRLVVASRGGETELLFECNLAAETYRQFFACVDPYLGDDEPAYSPDGTKVAFTRPSTDRAHRCHPRAQSKDPTIAGSTDMCSKGCTIKFFV